MRKQTSERYYHDQEDVVPVDQEADKEQLKLLTQQNGQMTLTSKDTVKPHHNHWDITYVSLLSGLACSNTKPTYLLRGWLYVWSNLVKFAKTHPPSPVSNFERLSLP